jgi:chromosome segregation ATPase
MVKPKATASEAPNIQELVDKLRAIQLELKQTLVNLQEKMGSLEREPELFISLESLKEDAESRASNLEREVKQLREELRAVKDTLGIEPRKK